MSELLSFLEAGRFDLVIIAGLLMALVWVTKQWREAEKAKDALSAARLDDVRVMVTLATEVKNNMTTLVKVVEGLSDRGRQ